VSGSRRAATPRRQGAARAAARPRQSHGLPGWAWAVGGIGVGALAMAVYFIAGGDHAPQLPSPVHTSAPPPAHAARPVPVPPRQHSRFSFYHLLPSEQVVIPEGDETSTAKPKPAPPPAPAKPAAQSATPPAATSPQTSSSPSASPQTASGGRYYVQVGAYRTPGEADRERARIALLGVESSVQRAEIPDHGTWFRVRVGPEPTQDAARSVLQRLHSNQVSAILVHADD
jgi:Cell division protein